MKVQQELMRHADIRTTMNIYGKAMEQSKRTRTTRLSVSFCLHEWLDAPLLPLKISYPIEYNGKIGRGNANRTHVRSLGTIGDGDVCARLC
jgi:integrase